MSIQAEIEAKVAALVDGVAELVRRVALQAAEEVLSPSAKLVTHAAAPSRPRTATRPAPKPMPQPARRPAPEPARAKAPHAPPAPVQRSLKEPRRVRLVMVPSAPLSEQALAAVERPMPAVVRVPAKVARKRHVTKPPVAAPAPLAAAEPVPARNWVVVRRPAREPGAEAGVTTPTSSTTAPGAATPALAAMPVQPAATA